MRTKKQKATVKKSWLENTFDSIGTGFCVICNTNRKGKIVLIGKDGTSDGSIEEGVPAHVACIQLRCSSSTSLLYQKL